jgi:hypothetical protein
MMDEYDLRMPWTCSVEEKDAVWYHKHFKTPNSRPSLGTPNAKTNPGLYVSPSNDRKFGGMSTEDTKKLVERDDILKDLLKVEMNDKLIVSKHYFHHALLTEKDASAMKGTKARLPKRIIPKLLPGKST